MTRTVLGGRCLCGQLCFELAGSPLHACHCHCESCQRASGAPFVTWATFPSECFRIVQGELRKRQSSPGVTRGHCATCGSSITYLRRDRADEIDIAACCLDQPSIIVPRAHIWLEDKQPWIEVNDSLPQYRQGTNRN